MEQEFTIEDLEKKSGLSLRTLRYYISEGLLPGPDTAGKYASYSQQHLDHLTIIQRLKRLHLPLKEIRHLLENMTPEDMHTILEYQDNLNLNFFENKIEAFHASAGPESKSSALEYITDLENRQNRWQSLANTPPAPASPRSRPKIRSGNRSINEPNQNYKTTRESWTKTILIDGIELNVRESEAHTYQREIEELIKLANTYFGSR